MIFMRNGPIFFYRIRMSGLTYFDNDMTTDFFKKQLLFCNNYCFVIIDNYI